LAAVWSLKVGNDVNVIDAFGGELGEWKSDTIDINTATESEWALLPKIGPKSAREIVEIRELLGCFRSVEQLRSVSTALFNGFYDYSPYLVRTDTANCRYRELDCNRRFNLNAVSKNELISAKLMTEKVANKLLQKRTKFGGFKNWTEVSRVSGIFIFMNGLQSCGELGPIPDSVWVQKELRNKTKKILETKLDLNRAGQSELEKINGVGPKLALLIVNYRKAMGCINDVGELIHLSGIGEGKMETIRQNTYVSTSCVQKKIAINRLSLNELLEHPLLNVNSARAIDRHRNEVGRIEMISDLFQIKGLGKKQLNAIAPHLDFE
jgi:competence ComEA-like helix-hairpin-helix protein